MFILSSVSNSFKIGSVNRTSIYKNSELKVFKNVNLFGEIFCNWPNDFFDANVY